MAKPARLAAGNLTIYKTVFRDDPFPIEKPKPEAASSSPILAAHLPARPAAANQTCRSKKNFRNAIGSMIFDPLRHPLTGRGKGGKRQTAYCNVFNRHANTNCLSFAGSQAFRGKSTFINAGLQSRLLGCHWTLVGYGRQRHQSMIENIRWQR